MATLRKMKALVVLFALVMLFAGAFSIVTTEKADASYGCCIWVMKCTVSPPIYCWEECIRVPCL